MRSVTFWVVVGLFGLVNVWTWLRHILHPPGGDQETTVGFPVPFHISGGISGAADFYLLGLLLDIAVITTIALTATWIEQIVRSLTRD